MKRFFASIILAASVACFADEYSDLANYRAGDSLGWFHSLRLKAQNAESAEEISQKLLETIKAGGLSREGFRLACNLLKPIADSDCVEVLKPYLFDIDRCAYVCDVFSTLDSGKVQSALKDVVASPDAARPAKENAVALLALLDSDRAVVIGVANDLSDKQLALFAVKSLARYDESAGIAGLFQKDVVAALGKILSKNDFRKDAALSSLVFIAQKAAARGDKHTAAKALEFIPSDTQGVLSARAMFIKDPAARAAYLDSIIVADNALSAEAAKLMNTGRKFENSQWLVSKFPSLGKSAKLAAMGSFMISGDTRFYPVIARELDNPDSDIRGLAVYSARFLCSDEANINKIYSVFLKDEDPDSRYAESVLLENTSYAVRRVLKERADAGDMSALRILIMRGDEQYRMKLWNLFFDAKTRTPAVERLLENTITSGELNLLATNYKVKDAALSKAITKIVIKKIAQYKVSRQYMAMAVRRALDGNLPPDDPNYKFIVSKLRIADLMK